MNQAPAGVLLMTFGSAQTAADVPGYMASVRGGRPAEAGLVAEFTRRYELIGFSPLVRITMAQGQALQELLDQRHGAGHFRVEVGMLHSEPRIDGAVQRLGAAGIGSLVGVILSPQWSPIIMGGYRRALDSATAAHLGASVGIAVAGAWHLEPAFIDTLATRVREAMQRFPVEQRGRLPVLLTAHSLPQAVVDREPGYLQQLMETVRAVAAAAGLASGQWQFAYQSAGHTPEEWLKPDLKDLLPGIAAAGHTDVLVVPVQFLADHLEILFDLDVAAREEAAAAGLGYHRIGLPNTAPRFIEALAAVVEREAAVGATRG